MPVTINGSTGVTFPNSTLQSSAAPGGGTNVTSATDVTLTSTSTQIQNVSITTSGKYVILPNATTCSKGGIIFNIKNTGAYSFGIKDADGNILGSDITWNNSVSLYLYSNSTSAGNWGYLASSYSLNNSGISYTQTRDFAVLSSTLSVFLYESNSGTLNLVAGSISGNTISFGTPVTGATSTGYFTGVVGVVRMSATSGFICYTKVQSTSYYPFVRGFTISGTTITMGTETALIGGQADVECGVGFALPLTDNLAVVMYMGWGGAYSHYVRAVTLSGSTVTLGTAVNYLNDDGYYYNNQVARIDSSRFVFKSGRTTGQYKIGSISGTTITLGSAFTDTSADISSGYVCYSSSVTFAGNRKIVSSGTTISSMTLVNSLNSPNSSTASDVEMIGTNSVYPTLSGSQVYGFTLNSDFVSPIASLQSNWTATKIINLSSNVYLAMNGVGAFFLKVLA